MFGFGGKVFELTDTKGRTWYLHKKRVELRNNNGMSTIYFFAQKKRSGACDMPEGFTVMTSPRTGIPMLRKR